jgi:glutamine synthetase
VIQVETSRKKPIAENAMSAQTPSNTSRSVTSEPGHFQYKGPERPEDITALIRDHHIEIVDLRFTDLPGLWQHFSIMLPEVGTALFEDGIGFDGSSIRGFQEIHESDMLLVPDCTSAFVDPFCETPTLALTCNVIDPILRQPYSRDPRCVVRKAQMHLAATGIADACYFGPELEFFIFDSIRFGQDEHSAFYFVESAETSCPSWRARPALDDYAPASGEQTGGLPACRAGQPLVGQRRPLTLAGARGLHPRHPLHRIGL